MDKSSLVLLCTLLACSVWMIQGKCVEIKYGDEDQNEEGVSAEIKIPGVCWACKWALNKMKKLIGNTTAEVLKAKLLSVCDEIGLLKSQCRKFVKGHLGVLVEELTTSDDVRTICVNTKACKPKELLMKPYMGYPESQTAAEAFSGEYLED